MSNALLSTALSANSASTSSEFDLFSVLEERGKSTLGAFMTLVEELPYEKIEQIEMAISKVKFGKMTKTSAKYFLVSFLGNISTSIVEDVLNLDLSVVSSAFTFVGNVSGLFLALGLTLDLKRAWKESNSMTEEQILAQRTANIKKFDDFFDELF